jgi:hypothetical protein
MKAARDEWGFKGYGEYTLVSERSFGILHFKHPPAAHFTSPLLPRHLLTFFAVVVAVHGCASVIYPE